MNKTRLILASTLAATLTVVFVVVVTVWGELSVPLKSWMAALSGHHWVTKRIFSVVIYAVATGLLYAVRKEVGVKALHTAIGVLLVSTLLGTLVLAAFYSGHHVGVF